MSKLFTRKATIALWTGSLFGILALFGPSLTVATTWLLLFVGVVPPTILLVLSKTPPPTLSEAIAQELRPADRSRAQ